MNRAVFLDRDGVLNEDRNYITTPDNLVLLPGAAEAVALLHAAGWRVIVFTNQSGVARGLMSLETLETIQAKLRADIEAGGGKLTALYACPHGPESTCECRKPKPGMLRQAAAEHAIDLSTSIVVGDSPRDIAAGHAVGCKTILVLSGQTRACDPETFPAPLPDTVCPDLLTAVKSWIE